MAPFTADALTSEWAPLHQLWILEHAHNSVTRCSHWQFSVVIAPVFPLHWETYTRARCLSYNWAPKLKIILCDKYYSNLSAAMLVILVGALEAIPVEKVDFFNSFSGNVGQGKMNIHYKILSPKFSACGSSQTETSFRSTWAGASRYTA